MSHEIRSVLEHRPWALPLRPHTFYQQWNRVFFLHYRVPQASLQPLLPKGLEVHLFEGQAWASVVGFTMNRARLRTLPYPELNFDELNLRTYVTQGGKGGVYFLSIEGGSALSCYTTRAVTGLPYAPARLHRSDGEVCRFTSENAGKDRCLELSYRIGDRLQPDALDLFLTERYCLYHGRWGGLRRFEVHHGPWPLQVLDLIDLKIDFRAGGLRITGRPDRAAYAEGVEVIAWSPEKIFR